MSLLRCCAFAFALFCVFTFVTFAASESDEDDGLSVGLVFTGEVGTTEEAAVSKCFNMNMQEYECKPPNTDFCHKLECENGVSRGCGYGDRAALEIAAVNRCAQLNFGPYKPGSLHLCYDDFCNGGNSRIKNNAIVVIPIGLLVAVMVTKLDLII